MSHGAQFTSEAFLATGYYYVKDIIDSNARLVINDHSGSCICDMMSSF